MAKKQKMTRGVKKPMPGDKTAEGPKLPTRVHAICSDGNIFASIPDLSRINPSYFTLSQLESAVQWKDTHDFTEEDLVLLSRATKKGE